MITYDYLPVLMPSTYDAVVKMLQDYGSTGWRFVLVYNGYAFFEKKMKTEQV